MRNKSSIAILPCLGAAVWLAGCGGSSYGGGGGSVSVSVSPKLAAVVVSSQTQIFTATVTGASTAVTWSVDGTAGDRKSTRLNSSHMVQSRMPSSA